VIVCVSRDVDAETVNEHALPPYDDYCHVKRRSSYLLTYTSHLADLKRKKKKKKNSKEEEFQMRTFCVSRARRVACWRGSGS
jgi:hypothetical protein